MYRSRYSSAARAQSSLRCRQRSPVACETAASADDGWLTAKQRHTGLQKQQGLRVQRRFAVCRYDAQKKRRMGPRAGRTCLRASPPGLCSQAPAARACCSSACSACQVGCAASRGLGAAHARAACSRRCALGHRLTAIPHECTLRCRGAVAIHAAVQRLAKAQRFHHVRTVPLNRLPYAARPARRDHRRQARTAAASARCRLGRAIRAARGAVALAWAPTTGADRCAAALRRMRCRSWRAARVRRTQLRR